MKYTFDSTHIIESHFIAEEYFPVIVEFSSEELNNHFIEFNYTDTDMIELSADSKTNALKRFSLTLCNHYEIVDSKMIIPDSVEGAITLLGPDVTECKCFLAKVYSDGVEIKLSDTVADHYLKTGQLIFALSEDNELSSVYIIDLSEHDIDHVKCELSI
jgi:hypothetical protein